MGFSTDEDPLTLTPGQSLGRYRLAEQIGEGGMGVVWKASDTTLGRDVAVKILPDEFAADPERLARFDREARLLASLNHPNVAAIHGLETAGAVRFLVMELAQGEDLRARLARGAVPVGEAIAAAVPIAEALESAHDRGIVHRDLKPANVVISPDGRVKLLDFGLAKLFLDETDLGSSPHLSKSPTISGAMTGANVILGTAAYMSPEQARGRAVDRRADIWAFGVVLFEMLTGRQLFQGETISDTLAAVLKTDPDWGALPGETPARVRALLRRCLERDPRRRLRDIGEARILLEDVLAGKSEEPAAAAGQAVPARRAGVSIVPIVLAALVAGALAGLFVGRSLRAPAPGVPHRKFVLPAREGLAPAGPTISPDGRAVAYVAGDRLWVHPLDALDPKEIASDQGMHDCFWSPDGKTVAYLVGSRICKVPAAGGEKQTISDTRNGFTAGSGATWRDDGGILLSHAEEDGLLEVSSLGGDARAVLLPDTTKEGDFHEPHALPRGRGVIFAAHRKEGIDNITLWANGKSKTLLELPGQIVARPSYSPTGHILFERSPNNRGVWALPFSLDRLEATGEPFVVVPGGSAPSASMDGTLVCLSGAEGGALQLVWVDRGGVDQGPPIDTALQGIPFPTISPDERLLSINSTAADNDDLWIIDAARGTKTRLTADDGQEYFGRWTPAGDRIIYQGGKKGCSGADCWSILARRTDGSGVADTLARGWLPNVSPDGRHVFFCRINRGSAGWDIDYVSTEGKSGPTPLIESKDRKFDARVSPDGRYFAYVSEETGHREVYLKRFPTGEGKWQVSVSGGMWPKWSGAGDRLFYVRGDDIMEVEVSLGAAPVLGKPEKVFTRAPLPVPGILGWDHDYDVTPDGERFVILKSAGGPGRQAGALVIQNWAAEFAAKK